MLGNITLGQYFPGDSVVHRLDPRTKMVMAMFFIVLIFLIRTYWGYLAAFAFVLLTAALSRIRIKFLLRALRPLLFIILFTLVINVFFTKGGQVYWQWRFISITEQGVQLALFMALRLVLLILGTQALTLTTSPIQLTDAMESLFAPLKKLRFPVHELAMMMTIALRFIPTLLEETDRIMKAQASRGADFETGNVIRRARNMVPLLVPLFVSAFRRADELAMAMEARCYRGGEGRTRLKQLHYSRVDVWGALVFAVLVGLVLCDMLLLA